MEFGELDYSKYFIRTIFSWLEPFWMLDLITEGVKTVTGCESVFQKQVWRGPAGRTVTESLYSNQGQAGVEDDLTREMKMVVRSATQTREGMQSSGGADKSEDCGHH